MQHEDQTHAVVHDLLHLPDPSICPIVIALAISALLLGVAVNH